jgi:hypothetical protein
MHNALGITGAGLACLGRWRWVQPSTYGELGCADWMGEVDVKTGVVAYSVGTMRVILRFRSPRRVPKVAPVRFEDPGTGAYLVLSDLDTGLLVNVTFDIQCPRPQILSRRHQTCW